MSDLKGSGGELRATLHITRKATGKVEVVEIVGHTNAEQHAAIVKGRTHDAAGAMVGQGSVLNNHPKES